MRIGNLFSNIKLVFFVLFLALFVGFAIRDVRAGDASSPTIFLAFLVLIAVVFKPWRTASDEGSKVPPKKPGAYLLAPLFLMQDTLPSAVPETCDGWVSCHPGVTAGFVLLLAILIGGFLYGRKRARDRKDARP